MQSQIQERTENEKDRRNRNAQDSSAGDNNRRLCSRWQQQPQQASKQ